MLSILETSPTKNDYKIWIQATEKIINMIAVFKQLKGGGSGGGGGLFILFCPKGKKKTQYLQGSLCEYQEEVPGYSVYQPVDHTGLLKVFKQRLSYIMTHTKLELH